MMSSVLLSGVLLISGLNLPAQAAENPACFTPPASGDCSMVAVAHTRMQAARESLEAIFRRTSQESPNDYVTWYVAAANYLAACEHTDCHAQHLTVTRDLGSGWTESTDLDPYGQPGQCQVSPRFHFGDFTNVLAPNGNTALNSLVDHDNPGHRIFKTAGDWSCSNPAGGGSLRSMTFSNRGVLTLDFSENDGTVSHHWGLRTLMNRPAEGQLVVRDANTIRYQWPSGAYVDVGPTGTPTGSNFFAPSMWDPQGCSTDRSAAYSRHYTPHIDLVHGQNFVKSRPEVQTH